MGRPEELIRKQDAIRVINERLIQMIRDGCLTIKGVLHVKEMQQDIENLPAVQPEPPWIPCSKKLPDYGHEVLVSLYDWVTVAHRISLMYGIEKEKDGWIDRDGGLLKPEDMYAWMPFPDPYKGSGDEGGRT